MRVKHFGKEETEDLNRMTGNVFYGLPFSSSGGFAGDADTDGDNNEAMYLTDADMTFIQNSAGRIVYDETDEEDEGNEEKKEVEEE